MEAYLIASFRSRTHTLQFLEILKRYRIDCFTVNTPKEAGVGCGLSVKFLENNFASVKNLLRRYVFDSFAGFFSVTNRYGKLIIKAV